MITTLFATTYQDNGLTCTIQVVWDRDTDTYTVSNCSLDTEWCRHYGSFSDLNDAAMCYLESLKSIQSEI